MTGKVYQVKSKATGDRYALKCMQLSRIDPELLEDLKNEIELLKLMDHPNIIRLYEYYIDESNMYLILEFCDGGELFDRLHAQKGNRYSELQAAQLMFEMCSALGYCHYMGVSHRDLKLENFIFENQSPDAEIKLIDFGLSTKYASGGGLPAGDSLRRMTTMVGTPYYIAPEILNQGEFGSTKGYTAAVDCWSLGVIAYMLLSGTPPFKGRRDREVLQAVRRGKYTLSGPKWDNVSEEAKDFIRHLLVYNPSKRMTAEAALKHPWLQGARKTITTNANNEASKPLDAEVLKSLRDFSRLSAFKRAALEAIAFSMTVPSISHLREQFAKLDKENSGFVSLSAFLQVLQQAGISKEEATTIFNSIDTEHTNHISYTEFLAATIGRRLWLSRERIKDAFARLDVEGTGYITRENLKQLMGDDFTPEKVELMMKEADTKGDGFIDFEEFLGSMEADAKGVFAEINPVSSNNNGVNNDSSINSINSSRNGSNNFNNSYPQNSGRTSGTPDSTNAILLGGPESLASSRNSSVLSLEHLDRRSSLPLTQEPGIVTAPPSAGKLRHQDLPVIEQKLLDHQSSTNSITAL
jgi:calcium-dependent protein kinase